METATPLSTLRLLKGLKQGDLAKLAGVHVLTITAIENGRRKKPHPSTMKGVADALGVAIDSIKEFRLRVRHAKQRRARKAALV